MTFQDPASSPLRFDPRVSLATALASQPGVYALLLGSGVSTEAGVPTGWGVVENLVRRVAAASGSTIDGEDWEKWWKDNAGGRELGYSQLLGEIASTPPARRALLAGFFEPTEDELEAGIKTPGPAHTAIAQLVAKGIVRVIVTTNFDRLLEHALAAQGVMAQVISTDSDVNGMEPLQHAKATIIKVNGDYGSLDQRNTIEELSRYPPATTGLLGRVFDEYGVIVSGWSGEWDTALITAVKASANRRYPLYWASRAEAPSGRAAEVTARSGSHVINGVTADNFFPDLLERVAAVQGLIETPASRTVKLARLRRALPDPVRHLEVRALFEDEVAALHSWAQQRPPKPPSYDAESIRGEFTTIEQRFETLIHLFTKGILLDRDQQHDDLWVWVIQQALNARIERTGTYVDWWEGLSHYPAFLLLRAGTMAALGAKHESVIVRIAQEPTWGSSFRQNGREAPAYDILHLHAVIPPDIIQEIAPTRRSRFPGSYFVRGKLRPLAEEIGGGDAAGNLLLDRMEYRMALASHSFNSPENISVRYGAAGGVYIENERWHDPDSGDHVALSADFLKNGDHTAWGYRPSEHSAFEGFIEEVDQRLWSIVKETPFE